MRGVLLASLRHHTRRYVASAIAVVIGVAFVVATGMLTGATREGLTADVGAPVAGLDHVVAVGGTTQAHRLMAGAAERDVKALTLGYAMEPVSRDGVQLTRSADVGEVATEPSLQWQTLAAGRFPAKPDEALADVNAAKHSNVAVGDVLRVGRGSAAVDVTVVGTAESPAGLSNDLYVPWGTLERFEDSLWVDTIAWGGTAAAATDLVPDATVLSADQWIADRQAQISRGVDVIAILALIFVAIAFFVAVLVIANTFSILFAQRMREFALLRCVGVTRRQLRRSVRLEALALGITASVVGVVAGGLGGLGLVALVRLWFADMGAPTLNPLWVVGAFAVGVLVTAAAAWLPTRSATKVTPLAALRPDTGPDVRSAAGRIRLVLAVLFGATGCALLALSVSSGGMAGVLAMLAGGMLAFVGVLLFGPWLVPALIRAAGRLIGTGPVRRLAADNAVRNPRRTATTAASLLVGVTLTTAVLTGLASSRTGLDDEMDASHPLDATLTAVDEPLDPGLAARVAAAPGVDEVVSLDGTLAMVDGESLPLVAVDGQSGVIRGPADLSPADGTILLPPELGDRVRRDREVVLTIDGTRHVLRAEVGEGWGRAGLVSSATLARLAADAQPTALWARAVPGTDAEDLDGDLAALAGSTATLDGGYANRHWVNVQVDVMTGAVAGLLGISVVIALIGIGNTLGLSVLERGRENALLRAMGLTRQQLRRAMAAEGLLLSLVATLLGTAIGLAFAWVGVRVLLSPLLADAAMTVPVGQLAAVVLVAAVAGLGACVLPARRAARITPAAGLALDGGRLGGEQPQRRLPGGGRPGRGLDVRARDRVQHHLVDAVLPGEHLHPFARRARLVDDPAAQHRLGQRLVLGRQRDLLRLLDQRLCGEPAARAQCHHRVGLWQRQPSRLVRGVGDSGVHGEERAGFRVRLGGLVGRPVEVERLGRALAGEVVGEHVGQALGGGQTGGVVGGPEQPDRRDARRVRSRAQRFTTAGDGHLDAVRVHEGGHVVDVLRELRDRVVRRPRRAAAEHVAGEYVGARRAADAEVDASREGCLQQSELLGHDQRLVVGQHHAARADADPRRGRRQGRDQHWRVRRRHCRHVVVLGHPVAAVAELVGHLRQRSRRGHRIGRCLVGAHRHQVEDGERESHTWANCEGGGLFPGFIHAVDDELGDREAGRGRGRRCVAHRGDPVGMGDPEVVDEGAVALDRLCPNARGVADDVAGADLWHVLLGVAHVGPLGHRAADLGDSGAPVLACEAPAAGPAGDVGEVSHRDVAAPIALSPGGQHRVRSDVDDPGDAAGEVNAQEGVARVRHRVDQASYEILLVRLHQHVLTAERNDSWPGLPVSDRGQAVGVQPGAEHQPVHPMLGDTGRDHDLPTAPGQPRDLGRETDLPAGGLDLGGERIRHRDEVRDGGLRRVQRRETSGVRLDLDDLLRPDPTQSRDAVLGACLLQGSQPSELVGLHRHHELAHLVVGDLVLGAVVAEQLPAAGAQHRLETARLVVDARVHHARVVAGLVGCEAVLLLEDHHLLKGISSQQLAADRDPEDPASDHANRHWRASRRWMATILTRVSSVGPPPRRTHPRALP